MFINCPYCNALVATDPATDIPPERCPRCSAELRASKADVASGEAPVAMVASASAESPAQAASADPASVAAPIVDDEARVSRVEDEPAAQAGAATDDDMPAIAMPADLTPADAVAEAMLGPGAIEVEIAGKMPDDDQAPVSEPERDAVEASTQAGARAADARAPIRTSDDARLEPASEPDVATEPERGRTSAGTAAEPVSAPAPPATATLPIERRAKTAPSFVRAAGARVATPPAHAWRAPVAIAALSLLLALQLLLADRVDLAESARWRPLIASLCSVLRCTIPPWREAEAFTLVDRDVRPHPTEPGVLRVTASFRNDARWPQPWPRLALTLSDVDGREAGTRRFAAAEYLGAAPTQDELKSGQTATIAMDVIEPAPHIVAFTFEFH